jgi:hypothetical protein
VVALTRNGRSAGRQDTDEQLMDWMGTHGLLPSYVPDDPELREMAL